MSNLDYIVFHIIEILGYIGIAIEICFLVTGIIKKKPNINWFYVLKYNIIFSIIMFIIKKIVF